MRVHTKDGSATSGEDYLPVSEGTAARGRSPGGSSSGGPGKRVRNIQVKLKLKYARSWTLISCRKAETMAFTARTVPF